MKRVKLPIIALLVGVSAAFAAVWTWRDPLATLLTKTLGSYQERQRERARYESWAEERVKAELARERGWQARPSTPCATFGRGSAPQLCIEHLGASIATIGTPVAYRVRWRNLPRGAYIRVWSRNAAPAGQRWRYIGAQGAIAPQPLGGAAQGDLRVNWDGRGTYCAPGDLPMMCDSGEVGRYILRAAIMTGTDPFWPSWPDPNPVPVVYLAQSETQPFVLNGPPQPVVTPGSYYRSHPAHRDIVAAIRGAMPAGALGTDWYVERRIDRLGQWVGESRRFCARLELDDPLAGSVSVCFPRSRLDENGIALRPGDITASGNARLAEGLIRAEDAKVRASAYAVAMTERRATFSQYPTEDQMVAVLHPDPKTYDGSYQGLRDAARDAGLTYVEVNQPNPSFRDDPHGSWWLVEMSLWIGTIDGPRQRDWGRMALRVDHDGHVCRVDRTGAREGEGSNQRDIYSGCRPSSRRRVS